jgi:hypothetical protein
MANHNQRICGPCAAWFGAVVQLQMWNVQVAEGTLVQDLSMLASTSQSGSNSRLTVAEDPFGRGSI